VGVGKEYQGFIRALRAVGPKMLGGSEV